MEGEPPERPTDLDCCHTGCIPCVFDIYEEQLLKWQNRATLNSGLSEIRYDLLSVTKFKPFVLLMKTRLTENTWLLRFQPKLLENSLQVIGGVLPYAVGQHFIMKNNSSSDCQTNDRLDDCTIEGAIVNGPSSTVLVPDERRSSHHQSFITRAYTPITLSIEESNCCFNIIVKLYENGAMSKYIETLDVGDIVQFRGPYGQFNYTANAFKVVLMICIGTCIAPVYTVIRKILSDDNDETRIKLLYGCRTSKDVLLRDQLRNATCYWNFSLKYFISGESVNACMKFGEQFSFNRIRDVDVVDELTGIKSKDSCLVLICGKSDFNKVIADVCVRCGISGENIHIF